MSAVSRNGNPACNGSSTATKNEGDDMTGARAIVGRPGFYKCRTCAYWHPAGQACRPTHNGFTVGVLDAMHPDHDGDHFADWRAVKAPPQRRTHARHARR